MLSDGMRKRLHHKHQEEERNHDGSHERSERIGHSWSMTPDMRAVHGRIGDLSGGTHSASSSIKKDGAVTVQPGCLLASFSQREFVVLRLALGVLLGAASPASKRLTPARLQCF